MKHIREVEFVFFDVGNIFVSDDPAAAYLYRRLYEEMGGEARLSPEEFFALRDEHVSCGGNLWSFVKSILPAEIYAEWRAAARRSLFEQWEQYAPPIPQMPELVPQLAQHYRLGLIANQPVQVEPLLRKRGLWEYFEVTAISEALGIEKPDARIFQWALEQASIPPTRTLMVGDRIDNDVVPAKRLGMKTIWLSLDFDLRGWTPTDAFERAYAESVRRHCVTTVGPANESEQPDAVARSAHELRTLLLPRTVVPERV
ncbi:MAG: hypothetical protein KatS3mg130_2142 [Candidatus Sumerlaea sp.]|nr:MAG: hypothetical protein KatS3mg130_2142 [Candidatus Sumerlaea sp.]